MSSKHIIIPKGTVGPNDTLILDIPDTPTRQDAYIVARRLEFPPSPTSFHHNYSQVPTRTGSPSREPYLDQSSYWEGSPQWESQYFADDSSLGPYQSTYYEDSWSVPSSGRRGGNLRRMQAMGNLAQIPPDESSLGILTSRQMRSSNGSSSARSPDESSLGVLTSRQMRSSNGSSSARSPDESSLGVLTSRQMRGSDGSSSRHSPYESSLGVLTSRQMRSSHGSSSRHSPDESSLGILTSRQMKGSNGSSAYPIPVYSTDSSGFESSRSGVGNLRRMAPMQNLAQNSRSNFSLHHQHFTSPQRLVQSTSSIHPSERQDISQFEPPYVSTPLHHNPNATYDRSSPLFMPEYASTPISQNSNATYARSSSPFMPEYASTPISHNPNATYDRSSPLFMPEYASTPISQNPNATYVISSSPFMPEYASTPVRNPGQSSDFMPPYASTPNDIEIEYTEEESYEESSSEGDSLPPIATTHTKVTKRIDSPNNTSVETIEKTTEEPSEIFDSLDQRMDDSMIGRGNAITDRKSVKFKSTNSGVNFFSNHSIQQPNATYTVSGAGSLGIMQPDQMNSTFTPGNRTRTIADPSSLGLMRSSQMRSRTDPSSLGLMRSSQMRSRTDPSSLGLMRSSQMRSSSSKSKTMDCPCFTLFGNNTDSLGLMKSSQMRPGFGSDSSRSNSRRSRSPEPEELNYEDFNPAANSSATNLRRDQTYNTSGNLQLLEEREQTLIDRDLRAWQEARRQFIQDMTTLRTSQCE